MRLMLSVLLLLPACHLIYPLTSGDRADATPDVARIDAGPTPDGSGMDAPADGPVDASMDRKPDAGCPPVHWQYVSGKTCPPTHPYPLSASVTCPTGQGIEASYPIGNGWEARCTAGAKPTTSVLCTSIQPRYDSHSTSRGGGSASAFPCNSNEGILGGGCQCPSGTHLLHHFSSLTGTQWVCLCDGAGARTVHVICLDFKASCRPNTSAQPFVSTDQSAITCPPGGRLLSGGYRLNPAGAGFVRALELKPASQLITVTTSPAAGQLASHIVCSRP